MTALHRKTVGWLLAAVSVATFAATFVAGAALTRTDGVSPAVLSFLRFALAGAALFAWEARAAAGRRRLFAAPTRREWALFATLGPVGTSVMAWCVFMGCARVSTANASMADALTPLLILAFASLRTRRVTARQVVGSLFGFAGALLVIGVVNRDGLALSAYSTGDVYIFFAAATWALYSVWGRAAIRRLGAGPYTVWTMLFGAAAIGLALPFCDVAWPATPRAWALVAVLAFVCTLTPFWTWNAAQRFLPVSTLGVAAYFTPVFAVALAAAFLGERATALQWVGIALVCASAVAEGRS